MNARIISTAVASVYMLVTVRCEMYNILAA
jgi:hypothetical protein